tara:strand:- start:3088 stop:6582 length:3495 start_codon:yes stop_codon:yes gene_type:complete
MAIKVGGTEVVDNNRQLKNIASIDSGTVTAFNSALNTDPTKGTLTKTFAQNETAEITLSSNVSVGPVVSATKEVPQIGINTKGNWDVNSTASNYDFHNTAANVTLTPSTIGYNLSVFSYDSKSFNTGINIQGMDISSDGTRIYYVQNGGHIKQRTLSTAFDISTAGSETYKDISGNDTDPKDVTFKPDGTEMYVTGDQGNRIIAFALSTAWDITTASSLGASRAYTFTSQTSNPKSTQFKSDGTKMYVMGNTAIYEYSLSTAWNLSTASYTNNSLTISGQDSAPNGMALQPDGTKMFVVGVTNDKVYQYNFGTAWDLSTLSYNSSTDSFSSTSGQPRGIAFSANGGKLYIGDFTSYYIYQFTTGTDALALGSGSFASTDVGKRIVGNGGDVILMSTSGAFDTTGGSAFTDSSTIAAGSWQMFGLKSAGDASGITMSGIANSYSPSAATYTGTSANVSNAGGDLRDLFITPDGTKVFVMNTGYDLRRFTLSTPHDLSTISSSYDQQYNTSSMTGMSSVPQAITFSTNGEQFFALDTNFNLCRTYFSTGFTISSGASNQQSDLFPYVSGAPLGLAVSADGKTFYGCGTGGKIVTRTYANAYNIGNSNGAVDRTFTKATDSIGNRMEGIKVSSDGLMAFIVTQDGKHMARYDMTTANDISTMSYSGQLKDLGSESQYPTGVAFIGANEGSKIAVLSRLDSSSNSEAKIHEYSLGSNTLPTAQYHVGVTNTSGRIDSSSFTDINSMTAAQSAGTSTVNYAVSTDGRTTWSVAKGTSGVRPIVRNNSGTWQYNNNAGTVTGNAIANASYVGTGTFSDTTDTSEIQWINSGNSLLALDNASPDRVEKYNASTAYDITTLTYSQSLGVGSYEIYLTSMHMSPDGMKLYVAGNQNNEFIQYNLTTAFDLSTASFYSTLSFANFGAMWFKPDGTKAFAMNFNNSSVTTFNMSTAWHITGATNAGSHTLQNHGTGGASAMVWSNDGLNLYVSFPSSDTVKHYTIGTAWDVSTASASPNSMSYASQSTNMTGLAFNSDFTEMHTASGANYYRYSTTQTAYATTATWVDGTTNDELYTLQQALGAQAFNRMDKTQLDAVADANHFSTGSSLDLMIALRMDTAASTLPTSDGVTLNYDAAALNEGAVLGTDYDFFHPAANKVQIKSLAAQNLKVRVV